MSEYVLKTRLVAMDLIKKRTLEKDKKNLELNRAEIQVIGVDNGDYTPSVIVTSAGISHMFNCSEGSQRFCFSNKIKLGAIENIFVTNLDWNHISGLYGLTLTLQDVGCPKLDLFAAQKIQNYFDSTKNFLTYYTGMKCSSKTCTDDYLDPSIHIKSVPIDIVGVPKNDTMKTKIISPLVAYICKLPDLQGALDPQKCRELKVPIGPQLKVLKSGGDVTLQDGTIVRSEQVCSPPIIGLKFIVLECPSPDLIDQFVSNINLKQAVNPPDNLNSQPLELVIHMSPQTVVTNLKYQAWIESFPIPCKHILMPSSETGFLNFVDTYRLQNLLSSFDNIIFPPLYMLEETTEAMEKQRKQNEKKPTSSDPLSLEVELDEIGELDENELKTYSLNTFGKIIKTSNLDKITLRPKKELYRYEQYLNLDARLEALQQFANYKPELDALRQAQTKIPLKPNHHEPELVFLGTGSALPSKYRNTSNILLNFYYPERVSIMLDCGEDSHGQLYRFYGPERLGEVLKSLKLIYVSHHHADHHIGLIKLLNARREYTDDVITLLLPPGIEELLDFHNSTFLDLKPTYNVVSTKSLKTKPSEGFFTDDSIEKIKKGIKKSLNGLIDDIAVVPVVHCRHSCAVVMRFNINHDEMKTFVLSYSGDARPSSDLVIAGKDSDLLIHEATFDHNCQADAEIKKHCTSNEAIAVARLMRAKFVILTHFSQRLSKIPLFNEDFDDKVGFAFDNLQLRCPSHFARLPILKPILSLAFWESLDQIKEKHCRSLLKSRQIGEMLKSQKDITNKVSQN